MPAIVMARMLIDPPTISAARQARIVHRIALRTHMATGRENASDHPQWRAADDSGGDQSGAVQVASQPLLAARTLLAWPGLWWA
jgi:hypothetical protein